MEQDCRCEDYEAGAQDMRRTSPPSTSSFIFAIPAVTGQVSATMNVASR